MKERYYKPSGKISPLGVIYFLVIVAILAPVFALAYAYAIWYIPIIYLNFILLIFLVMAMGNVVDFVTKWGKIRLKVFVWLGAILFGVVVLYLHWAVWLSLFWNNNGSWDLGSDFTIALSKFDLELILEFIKDPGLTWNTIKHVNELGPWVISETVMQGTTLWILWGIEAVALIFGPVVFGTKQVSYPFCESKNTWAPARILDKRMQYVNDAKKFKAELENGNFDVILNVETEGEQLDSSATLILYECDNQDYLSVANVSRTLEKGKAKTKADDIVSFLIVDKSNSQKIQNKFA